MNESVHASAFGEVGIQPHKLIALWAQRFGVFGGSRVMRWALSLSPTDIKSIPMRSLFLIYHLRLLSTSYFLFRAPYHFLSLFTYVISSSKLRKKIEKHLLWHGNEDSCFSYGGANHSERKPGQAFPLLLTSLGEEMRAEESWWDLIVLKSSTLELDHQIQWRGKRSGEGNNHQSPEAASLDTAGLAFLRHIYFFSGKTVLWKEIEHIFWQYPANGTQVKVYSCDILPTIRLSLYCS